jgi:hypothetical protein
MAVLHVHLQDGFSGEPVRIRLDGKTVIENPAVTTRPQLGLAELIPLELPAGRHTLEVQVPAHTQVQTFTLTSGQELHVGLSLNPDGGLSYRISESPFGYV